jgi:hypothetical protein
MANKYIYDHVGIIRHLATKQTRNVNLAVCKSQWRTESGLLFRKEDGLPRGHATTATWVQDLSTVKPKETL